MTHFEDQVREEINRKLRVIALSSGGLIHIANQTGLNRQTVSRLLYGETKLPRLHTVAVLCEILEISIVIKSPAALRVA